jgi:hypothetical protein
MQEPVIDDPFKILIRISFADAFWPETGCLNEWDRSVVTPKASRLQTPLHTLSQKEQHAYNTEQQAAKQERGGYGRRDREGPAGELAGEVVIKKGPMIHNSQLQPSLQWSQLLWSVKVSYGP